MTCKQTIFIDFTKCLQISVSSNSDLAKAVQMKTSVSSV